MGNEMGNNNTSGFQEFDHADGLKGQNHVVQAILDTDSQTANKEEDEKTQEDAARTDYEQEQNHEVVVSEDVYVNGKDEKEEDTNMIPVDKELSMIESGYEEEAKGQGHLVPAAEDKDTRNETESATLQHDGLASPCIKDGEHDEKEQDSSTILDVEEMPLKEAARTEETNAEACLVPAGGDESTCGTETGQVSGDRGGKEYPSVDKQKPDEKEACQVPAGGDESNRGTETGQVSGDRGGMEYPSVDKQTPDEKEEDITVNDETEEQSSQEAASTDVLDRQVQLLPVVEDKATHGNQIGFVTSDPKGTADLNGDNPKEHEKEEDTNMIQVDKENSMKEAGYADDAEGQDHLVPAAEDKNTRGNETESVSLEHDGLASPHIEDSEHEEKEQDTSTILEVEEIPLKEAAITDETNAEARLAPAGGDESTHGTETGLVFDDHDGTEYPCIDKQKHDEKEDITINDEAAERSSQEAANTDVLATVEDKATHGNEIGLDSTEPEGTADLQSDNPEEHETEMNNTNAEPQEKPLAKDDIEEKNPTIRAAEGEDYKTEAVSASGDPVVVGDTPDNKILEGQEQGKTELDPPAESTEVDAKPGEVVGGSETEPTSSTKNLEDQEMEKESNFEENLSGRNHDVENQNPLKKEDEEASNSLSGAASSLEPDEHELAEICTELLVLECNGPVKSEDMIIPSLTCQDQENGFILDDSVSTDPVETVSPDLSPEAGKGRDEFLVEEMAIKEVSRDEKLELKDGDDEAGNGLGTITTVMTDLPTGIGAKCNGELPSEMNSAKNDSIESQNILVEASETELEDKGMVLSQKGASVEEESENGNAKQSHCQVQSAQEATEKPNGQGSEEGSKDDDQSALSPQFMMNGRQKEKITCLLNADCDSNKDCQFLQAKILENGHMVDASINHQKQQKDSQQEVQLVTDSSDTFFMDQMNKEESEEKKIIEEKKDSNPIENGKQCISQSYDPIEQMQGSDMAEVKQEPLWDLSEYPKPIPLTMIDTTPKQCSKQCANGETPQVVAIANGDYNNQRESVGRFSLESNPDTINSQMRKSPSFDLDLRIHARAEDSDQTPLLYQDKTTIESFSTQAEEKANTENGENPSQYESMATEEKAVTLERSDSEKSRTPFLGFLKEDEEEADEHNMLMEKNPKKQGNQSATNKTTTKVSTSVTTKGKVKRKPITAFFGTCMCCATVTN
ncbi:hypothetical protein ES319_D02G046700v1 [Gossypium barbadense]|uniref:Uncharacterized protein n=1 Tax=Gossypium barbadense TaxID=3634 RepID=A0A5J5SFK7_GOSBA|nr:hypothetical protein ES319_D02G046700v1 [Gossypium barbadense]KAB2039961.1 hypothetical protein ES319_D02G046700v1 [Gossypium barbadense]